MTATNPCYNPAAFAPDNKPLLSKSQWQYVQLYLQDCAHLPTNFPFADSQKSYNIIRSAATSFKTQTLPEAQKMANILFNQGESASSSFAAVLSLVSAKQATKETLTAIYQPLIDSATKARTAATAIFNQTKDFADTLGTQGSLLTEYKQNYINKSGGLKTEIEALEASITQERSKIHSAQGKILSDNNVIKDTKYYSWIPLIGGIVALAEIISHDKDIQKQEGIIKDALKALEGYNATLQKDKSEMAQLIYAEKFNQEQVTQINTVLPDIQKIEGVWAAIGLELQDVLDHIKKARSQSELTGITCLASLQLTTAQKEWGTVANDANDFLENFYLVAKA